MCLKDTPAGVLLETASGQCVAKLSREGNARWSGHAKTICEARIIGMVRWCADDAQEGFRRYLKVDQWEVPLVELVVNAEE